MGASCLLTRMCEQGSEEIAIMASWTKCGGVVLDGDKIVSSYLYPCQLFDNSDISPSAAKEHDKVRSINDARDFVKKHFKKTPKYGEMVKGSNDSYEAGYILFYDSKKKASVKPAGRTNAAQIRRDKKDFEGATLDSFDYKQDSDTEGWAAPNQDQ